MQTNQNPTLLQEDEIDLRELAKTIGKHKKKLFAFSFVVTVLTVVFTLSKPNEYQSQAVLISQDQSSASASMGGLNALAGLAGVSVGGGTLTPDQAYQLYLNDYTWMRKFLLATRLFEKLNAVNADKNYHFALGINAVYMITHSSTPKSISSMDADEREKTLFKTFQLVSNKLTISADKKSSAITISYANPDPRLAKEMVDAFLLYASSSLRAGDLLDMDKKLDYYSQELKKTDDVTLKTQLSQLMSSLIQQKVLAKSSQLYNLKIMTPPSVAYVQDKVGPKRALIVIVSFVTSLILGIFGIFFLEFIRKEKEEVLK